MTSMYCLKFFQLTAAPLLWARLQWETGRRQSGLLYVEDVDGDTSASFDSFNPWTVSYVDIYWQGDSYVCDFTY